MIVGAGANPSRHHRLPGLPGDPELEPPLLGGSCYRWLAACRLWEDAVGTSDIRNQQELVRTEPQKMCPGRAEQLRVGSEDLDVLEALREPGFRAPLPPPQAKLAADLSPVLQSVLLPLEALPSAQAWRWRGRGSGKRPLWCEGGPWPWM